MAIGVGLGGDLGTFGNPLGAEQRLATSLFREKQAAHDARKDARNRLALRVIAGRRAVDKRNKAAREQNAAETDYRGSLINSQRGGLASTILNLGGSGGDPNMPRASQAVGTQAAGAPPVPEAYETKAGYMAKRKEKGLDSSFSASMAAFMAPRPKR